MHRVLSLFALAITQILSTPGQITTHARGALYRTRSAVIGDPRRYRSPKQAGPKRKRASETEGQLVQEGWLESKSKREREKESHGTSRTETGREQLSVRGRGRGIVWAWSARVPTPVALALGFGTPSCPPYARVIGPPSLFHLGLSRTEARAVRASSSHIREVLLLSHRGQGERGLPRRLVASASFLLLQFILLAHVLLFLYLSSSFFVSFWDLFAVSLFLLPALPSFSLFIPPAVSLTLSRHPYRFKRGRSPFFLSATFFLCAPRPRTIFISTTCLAGWRLAISERASERASKRASDRPTRFATGSTLFASRGTRGYFFSFSRCIGCIVNAVLVIIADRLVVATASRRRCVMIPIANKSHGEQHASVNRALRSREKIALLN